MDWELPLLNAHKFAPLERCLYCGSVAELTSEHLVPYGLGGNIELPASSCKICAVKTSKFERDVLRGPMCHVRILLDIQSRRKHRNAPGRPQVQVSTDLEDVCKELPVEESPIVLHFPVFVIPGYFRPEAYVRGVEIKGVITYSFGPSIEAVLVDRSARSIEFSAEVQPFHSFARLVAKIAYGMAVATGAIKLIKAPSPIVGAILGDRDEIGKWVGTLTEPTRAWPGQLHRVAVMPDVSKGLLMAEVQLFSETDTPRYGVIVGELA